MLFLNDHNNTVDNERLHDFKVLFTFTVNLPVVVVLNETKRWSDFRSHLLRCRPHVVRQHPRSRCCYTSKVTIFVCDTFDLFISSSVSTTADQPRPNYCCICFGIDNQRLLGVPIHDRSTGASFRKICPQNKPKYRMICQINSCFTCTRLVTYIYLVYSCLRGKYNMQNTRNSQNTKQNYRTWRSGSPSKRPMWHVV